MTERFKSTIYKNALSGVYDGKNLTVDECCNLLNKLNNENEQLKKRNKRLEEKIQRERKSYVEQHLRYSKEAETKIKELTEENEQLKKENQRLDDLWGEKCVREYFTVCGENILKEMHDEKYGDKE